MMLRLAQISDLSAIMAVVVQCQTLLKAQGVDQWQDGYPSQDIIEGDIATQRGYILEVEGRMAAYGVLAYGVEPAYNHLRGGEWITCEAEYLTIHRLAVSHSFRGQGIALKFFEMALKQANERGYRSVRVDTHSDNAVMQRRLATLGFTYCGVVEYRQSERLAYERRLM